MAGLLRETYPPILEGTVDAPVHVVRTGEDALALWTEADEAGQHRPTVIVAAGNVAEATSLVHVRRILAESKAPPVIHFDTQASVREVLARETGQPIVPAIEAESPSERGANAAIERQEAERQQEERGYGPSL